MSSLGRVRASWPAVFMLGCTTLFLLVLGHEGRRVVQLFVLMAPALVWLSWPVRSAAWQRARRILVWAWIMLFVVDAGVRIYLMDAYGAAPDSALVLGAMANTNWREGSEYLSMHWRSAALFAAIFVAVAAAVLYLTGKSTRQLSAPGRGSQALCLILVLFCLLAYTSKPWRRLYPAVFWVQWSQSLQTLQKSWLNQQQGREQMLARATAAKPVVGREEPSTVVLVLTESINRDNLSLYGYGRMTNPGLRVHQQQLGEQLTVLRNAWSVDASTLPAVRNLFSFGAPDAVDSQHLVSLARAAGYKVWWISNHDDVAIEQQHARLADVTQMVNKTPGRSTASLDEEMLDELHTALNESSSERKFVIVHMLGAHPHYRLRFPKGQNPFDDDVDAVDVQMEKNGRAAWVRHLREEYDSALLYHDSVVSKMLQLTRDIAKPQNHVAWMYLSDHGQEVGHVGNHVGHSPGTAGGYRIPAIVWQANALGSVSEEVAKRPFRSDWAAWTLADLLALKWQGQAAGRNVLAHPYHWEAPRLPAAVSSFTD
ncbi:MAG: sulfatase-like hydrolase/transferase [Comamonas sp.]